MDETELNAHVGRRLKMERRARELTQQNLADACGVSFQQIHKYEQGLVLIPASMLWRLTAALAIPAGDLFPPRALRVPGGLGQ